MLPKLPSRRKYHSMLFSKAKQKNKSRELNHDFVNNGHHKVIFLPNGNEQELTVVMQLIQSKLLCTMIRDD